MGTEKEKKTEEGAVDDRVGGEGGRSQRAREAQKKMIEEAGEVDKAPEDANSAAWNRGRNAADPSRKKTTTKIRTT
jgi:hypothetical protein